MVCSEYQSFPIPVQVELALGSPCDATWIETVVCERGVAYIWCFGGLLQFPCSEDVEIREKCGTAAQIEGETGEG